MNINELIARWDSGEGKPYKGSLIDYSAYEEGNLSCMCAQGQVLHVVAGWSAKKLRASPQAEADSATAKALNISRAHAVLLRQINDRVDDAPSIVLTDPGMVLGDQWSKLLDFWCYIDTLDTVGWLTMNAAWDAARAAARAAAWDAAGAAAGAAARDAARDAARAAAGAAARDAARDAAWDAAGEIQGAALLPKFFFLPMFGFDSPADIPARPADYGVVA